MKKIIFISILVFVSSLVFAEYDLQSYLWDYDLNADVQFVEVNGQQVLYIVDYSAEGKRDYNYNVNYLLQVMVFYYEDHNGSIVTIFYEASDGGFSLVIPADFLTKYLATPRRERYDLISGLLDKSFMEYEQEQKMKEQQLPPPKKDKLFNVKK